MTQTVKIEVLDPPNPPDTTAWLDAIWSRKWAGVLAVVVVVALFGAVSALVAPRGPATTVEALGSLAAALGIGVVAGLLMGNRWAVLVAPAVYMIIFELIRLDVSGPTVDAIHLDSMLGVIAFVVGRVAHGLLVLLPLATGGLYGVWLADRLGAQTSFGGGSWTMTGLLTICVLLVAASIARPASTAPILGPDNEPLAGSIAELTTVELGGHEQALMIRGRSIDNPVLLYLAGGPGGTDLGAMRSDTGLEQDFVVVTWDQRGAGKSYPSLDPTDTLTLDQLVSDTVELTNYLRDRFDEDKIFVVGNSWGSTLGVLAAQQHPELFSAFVGSGQMVSQRETDVMFWEDTLAWAERTGRDDLAETLRTNGPPPYADVRKYEYATSYEHEWNSYPEFDSSNEMPAILFVPEYTWIERINGFRGFLDSAAVVYPQLQDIDFRVDVPRLDVPIYVVNGEHEARGRAVLAEEWFELVDAPHKEWIAFDGAGHRAHFDQPARFADLMHRVLVETLDVEGARS